ncbi:hypothetical protein EVAR_30395_1 [Eumeta japonica]|uniref:Uncharacterized protein n=1 Tax=Eumeta variegata TaxID=151549 RepID=A0A4C1W408_EUMVA|nr:hypothetical protein EVAR_30395_1 [Eumeta japonica]
MRFPVAHPPTQSSSIRCRIPFQEPGNSLMTPPEELAQGSEKAIYGTVSVHGRRRPSTAPFCSFAPRIRYEKIVFPRRRQTEPTVLDSHLTDSVDAPVLSKINRQTRGRAVALSENLIFFGSAKNKKKTRYQAAILKIYFNGAPRAFMYLPRVSATPLNLRGY